jgi:hypothetical protein
MRALLGRIGILASLLGLAFVSPGVHADGRDDDRGDHRWCDDDDRGHGRWDRDDDCFKVRGWKDEAVYQLGEVPLGEFLADELPALGLVDDHGVALGGIGSDLWHGEDDCPGVYWMITDRGPNGEGPRTFPVPQFTPFIVKVLAKDGELRILDAIPITAKGASKNGVTGIPNLENTTEAPALNEPFYGCGGAPQLDPNVNGLDPEGLVRTEDGTFYVVEEYSPSLVEIDRRGRVQTRWLPAGFASYLPASPDYPIADGATSIPAIYGLKRKLNRGFEGLALSPNEKTLYLGLQSPLVNPTVAVGNESRNTRILAWDVKKQKASAEYVYRFDFTGPLNNDDWWDVPTLPGNDGRTRPRDMKVSALAMIDKHRMLVLERTDLKARIYRVDLRGATNILGTKWDDVATAPSLETLNADGALEANGVVPLVKELIYEIDSTYPASPWPQKIEGLTILDRWTIAVANDNDFGVGTFGGPDCTLADTGRESQVLVIRLDAPLTD